MVFPYQHQNTRKQWTGYILDAAAGLRDYYRCLRFQQSSATRKPPEAMFVNYNPFPPPSQSWNSPSGAPATNEDRATRSSAYARSRLGKSRYWSQSSTHRFGPAGPHPPPRRCRFPETLMGLGRWVLVAASSTVCVDGCGIPRCYQPCFFLSFFGFNMGLSCGSLMTLG